MNRRENGYLPKSKDYPDKIRDQAASSSIGSRERRIDLWRRKTILKDLEFLIKTANRLLVEAGLPDQNLKKSGTESGTDFESLLNKLETLCLTIKDLYLLIDTSAMVKYTIVDTNFRGTQKDWFNNQCVPTKINEINLEIKDVAHVLKTLKRTLEKLERITSQDETSLINQSISRFKTLFAKLLANLVLAYAEFVSTHGEYNVGGLESKRCKEGKSLIGLSETILSVPVPEDELNKFLNFLEAYYDHKDGEYVIGFIVQLLNSLELIGMSFEEFLETIYRNSLPSLPSVGQTVIERIKAAVEYWLNSQKDDLNNLIIKAKEQIGGITQEGMTYYELMQLLLQKHSQQETQEKDLKDAIDVLGIFLKTFWGQELPQNIQYLIQQKTKEMEHCQLIVITAEKGGHSGLSIIINLNEQSAARPSNCSFGFGGDNAQVAIVPIYGGLGKMAHELTHSVCNIIGQDLSGPPDEFWTQLAEAGAVGNTRPEIYYELRRRIQDYRQGVLCIAQLRVIEEIEKIIKQMNRGGNEEELDQLELDQLLNQIITDIYEEYFGQIGIGLPGKTLSTEISGPRPDGFEYVSPNLKRLGSSESKPENNKLNVNLLKTMILKFQDHFGQGWMTNENAVAVFLATMIRANTELGTVERTFDDLKNNLGEARIIIEDFRKRNLNQIGKINVLIMSEDSVFEVSG